MQTGAATLENGMEVPQKIKNRPTLRPSNCTTRYLSEGYKNADLKGHRHSNVYSSTNNKVWKEPKCPLTDEWIKKMWGVCTYMHTMKYCHLQLRGWNWRVLC